MRIKTISILIGILILLIITIILINYNSKIFSNDINNSITFTPNPTFTVIPSLSIILDTLEIPPSDFVINNISWSSYPNLSIGYLYKAYIADPNSVIPYKFIEIQICTEVKGTEERTVIEEQLGGVAIEAKRIYGPSSSINIIGTKDGVARWFATILPYEDTVRH